MKLGIEGMYLNIIKDIYDKPVANVVLNGKKLKSLPLKSGMRQWCFCFPLLFNLALDFLIQNNKARESNKRDSNRKGRSHIIPIFR
jgi:hypothetical protein